MKRTDVKSIIDATYRANPRYELIPFERLPLSYKQSFNNLQNDVDFYGVLMPKESSGLGVKSICRETALLFYTLQQEGEIPYYIRASMSEGLNEAMVGLVLGGVLEMKCGNSFVTGADAYGSIYGDKQHSGGGGIISGLSIEALKYAQELEISDALKLSARIYFYNRIPISSRLKRNFPDSKTVAEYIGIGSNNKNRTLLEKYWKPVVLRPPFDGWLQWKSKFKKISTREEHGTYKLYLSPQCEYIPEAFSAILEILSELQTPAFKIGKDIYGILRPDKIVAYFSSFEEVEQVADALKKKLDGCPAHGVPFTAELACNGLISWGIDPPKDSQALNWQERESWRLWVTNRLAVSLITAKTSKSEFVEPWQFAVDCLHSEGVDTANWIPNKGIWCQRAI